jgi:spermidine synthase
MLTYTVLVQPTPAQINQITMLYRNEGWWTKEVDDPKQVTGIVTGSHVFVVAKNANEIVGMGRAISDKSSDAYIQDVTVKSEYRGRGIGTTIINKLVSRLSADGIEWIGLIAERGSHGFYSRLGFKPMANAIPMLKTFL